jgi:tRNA threonylcarbamoyladenosine biosynthesis protein TsaB
MAVARGLPVIGVSAFDIVAAAQPRQATPIYALVEAGRGRVAACRYEWLPSESTEAADAPTTSLLPAVAGEWHVRRWQEFADSIEPPAWVCGDLAPALIALLGPKASVAPAPLNLRRAGYLAELGYARWRNGETDDAMSLMPIYPGDG